MLLSSALAHKSPVQLTIDSLLKEAWAQARSRPEEGLRLLSEYLPSYFDIS